MSVFIPNFTILVNVVTDDVDFWLKPTSGSTVLQHCGMAGMHNKTRKEKKRLFCLC